VIPALPYVYLGLSILAEVIGTAALNASGTFTRPGPTLIVLIAYPICFFFFALSLRAIPVGIAYALWSGLGMVLVALIGWLWFKQSLDLPALIGLGLIIGGVIVVNTFSQTMPH
jgi:small multidrug resistance pump